MKLVNLKTNHPCIFTLIKYLALYPFYFALFALYVHIVPVYQNALYGTNWQVTKEGLIAGLAMVSALPWMITTIVEMIASRNPYNKFGCFFNNFSPIIIDAIFYLSISILYDVLNGGILLPSHLALLTIVLPRYIIRTIMYIIWIRKIKKVNYNY